MCACLFGSYVSLCLSPSLNQVSPFYFCNFIFTAINLQNSAGSKALIIGSVWCGIIHLLLGILGTFVLKRFPTAFAVGFFLGTLCVLGSQNLILFGTYHGYKYGSASTNHVFANVGLTLFFILFVFSLLLFHFKRYIVVAPIDAKGLGSASDRKSRASADYQAHDETPDS
jgi:hypothetical protein